MTLLATTTVVIWLLGTAITYNRMNDLRNGRVEGFMCAMFWPIIIPTWFIIFYSIKWSQ